MLAQRPTGCQAGIRDHTEQVCCNVSCGACGGHRCSGRPGGPRACCIPAILRGGRSCRTDTDVSCILAQATPAEKRASAASRLPRIYTYDLPARSPGGVLRDGPRCEDMRLGNSTEQYHRCLFGPTLEFAGLQIRNIDHHAAGRVLFAHMQEYPHRTDDPAKADLFYIPMSRSDFLLAQSSCPKPDWLLSKLPHLNTRTASRHILLNPRPAWHFDVCREIFNAQSGLLARVTKLGIEDRHVGGQNWRAPKAVNLHSYPYPSMKRGAPWRVICRLTTRVRT